VPIYSLVHELRTLRKEDANSGAQSMILNETINRFLAENKDLFDAWNQLENEKSFYEDFFENTSTISCVTDEVGNIIRANNKAKELFLENDISDFIGKNLIEFIHKDDREKVVQVWTKSISSKKVMNYEVRMITPNGKVYYFLITGRPIIRDGKVISFHYQALDIIDQKVQEQSMLHSASVDILAQISGGFAHDFNNMLTVINGYSEILKMSIDETHPFYHKIAQICQAGKQASALTQRMLEFSKKSRTQVKSIVINEEISNQEGIIKHVIGESIRLMVVKSPELESVSIDPSRFATLLLNLAINAKDSMPDGGELTISTNQLNINTANEASYPQMSHGNYLLLTVKDTGTGMTDDMKKQIFDPFFSNDGRGNDVGLWTVRNIVKEAKGSILVESAPGAGTTFKVLFPFSILNVKQEQEVRQVNKVQGTAKGGKTILVVEDDDTVRDLVSEVLKQQGHITHTARNGGDALQLVRQLDGKIDLLITDMVMRRIDGSMLSKKMKSIWPHIKVLIMSGYGNDVINEENIKDYAFLQKPFLPQELIDRVSTVMQG
jgi:two-component system, cell cycle sensor histidine kinase and response regulator CckA